MPKRMTLLEELIAERTRYTLAAPAVGEVELMAEQFANALLRDPVIRPRLRALIGEHFRTAEESLLAGELRRNGRKRRGAR